MTNEERDDLVKKVCEEFADILLSSQTMDVSGSDKYYRLKNHCLPRLTKAVQELVRAMTQPTTWMDPDKDPGRVHKGIPSIDDREYEDDT